MQHGPSASLTFHYKRLCFSLRFPKRYCLLRKGKMFSLILNSNPHPMERQLPGENATVATRDQMKTCMACCTASCRFEVGTGVNPPPGKERT